MKNVHAQCLQCLLIMVFILNCRAGYSDLQMKFINRVLEKLIQNLSDSNNVLHYEENAHKMSINSVYDTTIERDDKNILRNGLEEQNNDNLFLNNINDYLSDASKKVIYLDTSKSLRVNEALRNANPHNPSPKKYLNTKEINPDKFQANNDGDKIRHEHNTQCDSTAGDKSVLRSGCVLCAKTQIRKCYKALKTAPKIVCATYYCKSDFKKSFKTNSKSACMQEFSNDGTKGHTEGKNKVKVIVYVNHKDGKKGELRGLKGKENMLKIDSHRPSRNQSIKLIKPVLGNSNILRQKYEKACRKSLSKKCWNACASVIKLTCAQHSCKKRLLKGLKRDCKRSCSVQFGVASKRSDSSSEESEETEESEESDDSD